jgi:transketolase
MGSISAEVMRAAESLAGQGVSAEVMVVASIYPPPVDDLTHALARFKNVISIEAHHEVGGIGSLISEQIAERGLNCRLVRCGVKKIQSGVTGSQTYMHAKNGLSCDAIVHASLQALT